MRKIKWIIFSLLCSMIFSLSCFAQAKPDPFVDPKVKQESLLINYILDDVKDYVVSVNWMIWNPKEEDRAAKIGKIIEKYEYSADKYFVSITSFGEPNSDVVLYYVIMTCIWYKTNDELSTCDKLIIAIVPNKELPNKGVGL